MAKIIKNNVVYNQSPATASGVSYNNTSSGLSSNTVQNAIDEVANSALSRLPTAYIKFTSIDSISSWSETATVYSTVTITDEYGNTLTPSNLRDNTTKELLYGIRIEYVRLDSSDNIIGHYIFGDISAQYNDFINNYYVIGNMNYLGIRYEVNFSYDGSPTEHYVANCYKVPVTYDSKTAASSGTDLSLVTTGEKYTWNNKADASDFVTSSVTTPTLSNVSTSTSSNEIVQYWKSGKVVTMTVDIIMATTSQSLKIFQLNSEYRPPVDITTVAQAFTSSTTPAIRYMTINANGNVTVYSGDQARLLFTVTFVAA